ncbi:intermembrane phospholipid transport protein YdbH family protein [Pseudomonas sp. RL_15y_Pfl2_60]|uniref:intermembrane phospholipid transport protein YdbH family protein n=1 Tax=Pseudomonas sp. RL_15y_Pfl2_60 TaxID=3088709 RepID=UPI0030D847B8
MRRIWLRLAGLFVLLCVLAGIAAVSWQQFLQRQHISRFDWQGLSFSLDGIHLHQLQVEQQSDAATLSVQSQGLTLGWRDFSTLTPFWQHIELEQLNLDWQEHDTRTAPTDSAAIDLLEMLGPLALMPQSLSIGQLSATLPCAQGRCTLQGDLRLNKAAQQPLTMTLQSNLRSQDQLMTLDGQLQRTEDDLNLQFALQVDGQPQLGANLSLRKQTHASGQESNLLSGAIAAPNLNQASALQHWLSQWVLPARVKLPEAPGAAALSANWQLDLPAGPISVEHLLQASGTLTASANLPEPWPVPGIGQVQGALSLALEAQSGQWIAEQIKADLKLQQLAEALRNRLPAPLQNDQFSLSIQPAEPINTAENTLEAQLRGRHLPLALNLSSSGASSVQLQAKVALANTLPWAVQVNDATLNASSKNLQFNEWTAQGLDTTLVFNGYADAQQIRLNLDKSSRLQLAQLTHPQISATGLDASLAGVNLSTTTRLDNWQVDGPLVLSVKSLQQPALKAQSWSFKGKLQADPQTQVLDGSLATGSGLQAQLAGQNSAIKGLQLEAKFNEIFFRAGNPLKSTLSDWPALLDLNNGRLNASARLSLAPNKSTDLTLDLASQGLSGIYDRTLFSGLTSEVQMRLANQRLLAEVKDLKLTEANPGIALGPIALRGRYSATLSALDKGQLTLLQAKAQVLGGQVTLPARQWDLKQPDLLFALNLKGLKLENLFAAYPAEGLSGSGLIDGSIPLHLNPAGLSVEQGQISARQPGGRLQFHNDKIKALGASNPAMQLVAQSLEDFHYTTLSSGVSYDPQGQLLLALRLEGRNPAIEKGRPINFNINLEENIPTLLASIQLSDKVSDIVQQRVQQFILNRNKQAAPKDN